MRNGIIYFTNKKGQLLKNITTVLFDSTKTKDLSVPWSISTDDDGNVFMSDLAKPRIIKVNNNSVSEILNSSILEKNGIDSDGLVFYRLNRSADKLVLSSGSSVYVYNSNEEKISALDSVRYSFKTIFFRFVL